jgi:exosortase A
MVQTWATSSSYHHGFVVAPIALWMIWRTGRSLNSFQPSLVALLAVGAAAATWLVGRAAGVNLVEQFGFVSLLIAGAAVCFGAAQFKLWAFPLLFLFFMIPFGGVILPVLQSGTAKAALTLLNFSGIQASLDGVVITTDAGSFAIAEACAGLNFLLAALIVAAVYSWTAFSSARNVAAFLLFAIALALVANLLRVYVVLVAATLTAGRYSIDADHVVFGWVFYGILLFALVAAGRRFADPTGLRRSTVSEPSAQPAWGTAAAAAIAAAFAIVAATGAYARLVVDRPPAYVLPASLPLMNVTGWQAGAPFPGWRAQLDQADRSLHASFQASDFAVQLALGYFAYDRPNAEIAGHSTRVFDGSDWRRVGARTVEIEAFGERRALTVETLESHWDERLDVAAVYWLGEAVFADPRQLKVRQARERLFGRQSRGGVIFVAAPARGVSDGELAIKAFFQSAEPITAWLARVDATPSN